MGLVYVDIELVNAEDLTLAKNHIIGDEDVKHMTVNMLVDSGAYNMCINESIQEQLDYHLSKKEKEFLPMEVLKNTMLLVLFR